MAVKDVLKVSRKTFFNPRGWLGYDTLKTSSLGLWVILKDLFTVAEPARQETFEVALKRLNLTEEDLKKSARFYTILTAIFVVLGSISFLFCFYFLFYHQTLSGCMLAIATAAVFFAQAFRYHFWLFQIKHRKLGCTLEEWRRGKPYDRGESKS
jgi:intracellular multiplication protein IcmV